ncbi:MAG: hypothetical protein AAF160_05205 [Pseudomonadota bacterium]
MIEGVKRVDVRLGNFACSLQGFDEPGPVLAAMLAAVRDAIDAGPVPEGTPETLDDAAAAQLLEEAAAASGMPADELEVARGLLVTARPATAEAAVDAVEEERATPRLDAEATAEIKRVLEQAARLPSAPRDTAALARSRFGRRERELDAPAEPAADDLVAEAPEITDAPEVTGAPEMTETSEIMEAQEVSEAPEPLDTAPEPIAEVEPEIVALAETGTEPALGAETVSDVSEEPLLLNIFDTPPPRADAPADDAQTKPAAFSLFGAASAKPASGLSEPAAAWQASEETSGFTGRTPKEDDATDVDILANPLTLSPAEETTSDDAAPAGDLADPDDVAEPASDAPAQRPGRFFGRGAQASSDEPAPVALLRPLANAAKTKPKEDGAKPDAPVGAGAPPSVQALAWRMGARTAEERVLCVAAWLTFAKSSPRFLRRAAFEQLDALESEFERDIDDRTDAFRTLLRDGALVQLGTESYALSEKQLDRAASYFD